MRAVTEENTNSTSEVRDITVLCFILNAKVPFLNDKVSPQILLDSSHKWLCKMCFCILSHFVFSFGMIANASKRMRNWANIQGTITSHLSRARGTWLTDLKAASKALHLIDITGTISYEISFSLLNRWMLLVLSFAW